jgi:hypothetical protein
MTRSLRALIAFAFVAAGLASGVSVIACGAPPASASAPRPEPESARVYHYTPTVQGVAWRAGDGLRITYTRTYADLETEHRESVASAADGDVVTIVLDTVSPRPEHTESAVLPDELVLSTSTLGAPVATVVVVDRHGVELFRGAPRDG